jgi:hypothetical protein
MIYELSKMIADRARRRSKLPRPALMPIGFIALGLLGKLLLYDPLLNGFHRGRNNGSLEFRKAFFNHRIHPLIVNPESGILNTKRRSIMISPNGFLLSLGIANPFIKAESVSFFKKRINHSIMSITSLLNKG